MDVIQRIHQSCELVQIVACGGSCPAAFKIEYFNGRSAGSKVNTVLGKIQVIFSITTEKNYTLGCPGCLGFNYVFGKKTLARSLSTPTPCASSISMVPYKPDSYKMPVFSKIVSDVWWMVSISADDSGWYKLPVSPFSSMIDSLFGSLDRYWLPVEI